MMQQEQNLNSSEDVGVVIKERRGWELVIIAA